MTVIVAVLLILGAFACYPVFGLFVIICGALWYWLGFLAMIGIWLAILTIGVATTLRFQPRNNRLD